MPISGWIVSGSMQTPTTTMRVPRGAAAITWSSTPGTPTHSKTTGGRPRLAQQRRPGADARADRQRARGGRPVLDDLGAELVAHDDVASQVHHARVAGAPRGLDELVGVLQRVEVGAADAAGEGAHQ